MGRGGDVSGNLLEPSNPMLDCALTDFVTLFVTVDPIGTVPVFLAISGQMTQQESSRVANQAVLVAAGVLLGFLALGQILLRIMDISMPSFQVAGGIVLFLFAMSMVFGHSHTSNAPGDKANPAVFPLAMPLIAGPGAILAAVVLTDNDRYNFWEQAVTALVLLGVLTLQWILLRMAGPIQRRLGNAGASILSRVMGLLLSALAVETVVGGIHDMLKAGALTHA